MAGHEMKRYRSIAWAGDFETAMRHIPDPDPPGGHHYGFRASELKFFFWLGKDAEGFHARG